MLLSEFKLLLADMESISFHLPNGNVIPPHFHITEAGLVTKTFVDCGGKLRSEKSINFQIWVAGDTDHKLTPSKLLQIIKASETVIGSEDLEIEIEYQMETIGKFGLEYSIASGFRLSPKFTNCLAADHCGLPTLEKIKVNVVDLVTTNSTCCTQSTSCC